ncbi:MAG: uncharacterized protein PWR01_2729 [Clostridiales bacterium]|jgi:uncharacterized membrane protein YraQ (UPF0718 family)/copper chaperone CopZ|nr:uncharacterized protein [Clostridiales bacterium]MDN5281656.1 uncharacterized protein [Candidatus Ozemobacter sp.]
MLDKILLFLQNCWVVLGQMSPYLLLGFLISGILSIFISPRWVEKHLGGGKIASIIKATLFGIPLPLCSCGVIPVSASLRKHGASKSATTSFLLSTPQTGVDSILATWGLLGGVFAIFRPLAALITGVIGGILVSIFDEDTTPAPSNDDSEENTDENPTFKSKVAAALKYGLVTLPGEIAKALMVGILIAGLISTFVSSNALNDYLTNYYLTLFLMLAVGVPLYVCSTSSIPIALGFIHLGVSPGAALVFLISGPATNAAAISVVWKVLGKKSAIIYLLTVIFGSLASGMAFDAMNQSFSMNVMNHLHHGSHDGSDWFSIISAVVMLVVLAYSWYKARFSNGDSCCSTCSTAAKSDDRTASQVFTLKVEGMSCGNCAAAVKRVLEEVPGVIEASVSLNKQKAIVRANLSESDKLAQAVNDLGYSAELISND